MDEIWTDKTAKELIEELKKSGIKIDEFKQPNRQNPQPIIPSVWRKLPIKPGTIPYSPVTKDWVEWEQDAEERALLDFMQECRERTAGMKDTEKCERCKLRFRCYTEIKIEKKRKTKTKARTGRVVLDDAKAWKEWKETVDGVFNNFTKPNTKTKSRTSNY